jgi:hypothetical protein
MCSALQSAPLAAVHRRVDRGRSGREEIERGAGNLELKHAPESIRPPPRPIASNATHSVGAGNALAASLLIQRQCFPIRGG